MPGSGENGFNGELELRRCATGESWPSIMLSCVKDSRCDEEALKNKDGIPVEKECGSNVAYIYFVSFIFFCSFLVRTTTCACAPL